MSHEENYTKSYTKSYAEERISSLRSHLREPQQDLDARAATLADLLACAGAGLSHPTLVHEAHAALTQIAPIIHDAPAHAIERTVVRLVRGRPHEAIGELLATAETWTERGPETSTGITILPTHTNSPAACALLGLWARAHVRCDDIHAYLLPNELGTALAERLDATHTPLRNTSADAHTHLRLTLELLELGSHTHESVQRRHSVCTEKLTEAADTADAALSLAPQACTHPD